MKSIAREIHGKLCSIGHITFGQLERLDDSFFYSFIILFSSSSPSLRGTIISDPRPMTMSIDTIDTIGFQPHISPLTSFPCSVCLAFPIELHSPSRSLCQDLGL